MKKTVKEYIQARTNLFSYFGIEDDIYIKTLTDSAWSLREDDGWQILSYTRDQKPLAEVTVAKKNGSPMIYVTRDYTMVVAIDCVKVGFVFKNQDRR